MTIQRYRSHTRAAPWRAALTNIKCRQNSVVTHHVLTHNNDHMRCEYATCALAGAQSILEVTHQHATYFIRTHDQAFNKNTQVLTRRVKYVQVPATTIELLSSTSGHVTWGGTNGDNCSDSIYTGLI